MSISLDTLRLRRTPRLPSAHRWWSAECERLADALFERVTLAKSKHTCSRTTVPYTSPKICVLCTRTMDLHHRSDQDLLSGATKLVGSHRELTAKLAAYLAEIE